MESSTEDEIPTSSEPLAKAVNALPAPPFLSKGQRVERYRVTIRFGCGGPAQIPGTNTVGTLIYCVSEDHKQAWVTVVALTEGQLFGPAQIFHRGDHAFVKNILAPSERTRRANAFKR